MGFFNKVTKFAKKVGKRVVGDLKDPIGRVKKDLKRVKYDAIDRPRRDLKKYGMAAAGAIGGFFTGGPAGALMGASQGYQMTAQRRHQRKALNQARQADTENQRLQQEALNDSRRIDAEQRRQADSEAERLQREESDNIRSKRKRGRRSLLSQDEVGVPNMRKTLG